MTPKEAKEGYGATHFLPMRDGVTPQMYYKQEDIGPFSDGSPSIRVWVYLSYANLWMGSQIENADNLIEIVE